MKNNSTFDIEELKKKCFKLYENLIKYHELNN